MSPSELSDRSVKPETSIERSMSRFQEQLSALERECQIFRTFAGWKDASHLARARQLFRDLDMLELRLMANTPRRVQAAFQCHNLLLRYQTFKHTFRPFWEELTGDGR